MTIFPGIRLAVFISFLALTALLSAQNNPVPLLNNPIVPASAVPGGGGFTITVNGTGFVPSSVVNWNGGALATTFVSGSQLAATVPASNVATAGTASVTVVNPAPGGGSSNVDFFDIRQPFSTVAFGQSILNTGSVPYQLIAADVNNDGKLDLVVCELGDSSISVSLGNGDGTFQGAVEYAVEGSPFDLVGQDFNHDGILDLAVANLSLDGSTGYVSILLGNGDGTFQAHKDIVVGTLPLSLTVGDLNGDGNPDLAVSINPTSGSAEVMILLGNGDGTFENPVNYNPGSGAGGVTTADFNHDDKLDIAVVSGSGVSILLGNGDGSFQPPVNYATAQGAYVLTTADFNGDGNLDLAVQTLGGSHGYISVLVGNGDGTFQNAVNEATPQGTYEIIEGDFNGDGIPDLATTSLVEEAVGTWAANTWLGHGNGTFQAPNFFLTGDTKVGPFGIATGDFNGDGLLDFATANEGNNTVSVLLQGTAILSHTFIDFGGVKVGRASKTLSVKLTNMGASAISISGITLTGTYAPDFKEKNNCGSALAPGASCSIAAFFKPLQSNTPMTAIVNIMDSAVPGSQGILLEGIAH